MLAACLLNSRSRSRSREASVLLSSVTPCGTSVASPTKGCLLPPYVMFRGMWWRCSLLIIATAVAIALLPRLPMPDGRLVTTFPKDRLKMLPEFPVNLSGWNVVNDRLLQTKRIFEGLMDGSESAVAAADGHFAFMDKDGKYHVARPQKDGSFALDNPKGRHVGLSGRPLGFLYDKQGRLVVCDSSAGLLRFDPKTKITEVLSNALPDGTPLRYVDDVTEGSDGSLYFTSACEQPVAFNGASGFFDTMRGAQMDLAYGTPTGRLLRWDPATRATEELASGLFFANGVALAPDDSFVLVAETFSARVMRVWLRGERAGQSDVFVDQLPGFPDGVSRREGGGFWIALVNPPSVVAWVTPYRAARSAIAHTIDLIQPLVKRWGAVAHVGHDGKKLTLMLDRLGERVQSIPAVHQHGRRLIFGNLQGNYASYLDLEPGE